MQFTYLAKGQRGGRSSSPRCCSFKKNYGKAEIACIYLLKRTAVTVGIR